MTEPDETLRQLVAAEHGLDRAEATFVAGTTLAELESSAAALARLLREQRGERLNDQLPKLDSCEPVEEVEQPFDPFDCGQAIEAKRQRQAELARALCGPASAGETSEARRGRVRGCRSRA